VIFKVYDIDGKGKVTFKDLLEVLRDLTGSFMSDEQREVLACHSTKFCTILLPMLCDRFY
jgi:Ca2+-binding EF-hand superfamily protein